MTKDYVIRLTAMGNAYEIHKFDGGDMPEVTYTVSRDHSGKLKCNCPSGKYRGYCKHTSMVSEFRKSDMVSIFVR